MLRIRLTRYDGISPIESVAVEPGKPLAFAGAEWRVDVLTEGGDPSSGIGSSGTTDYRIACSLLSGEASECSFGAFFEFREWSGDNYVLLPGAVYAGNRFDARSMPYPPLLRDQADIGVAVPTIVSDVQRLSLGKGPSKLEQTTQDPATPAVAFYSPGKAEAVMLFTTQLTEAGPTGLSVEESDDRDIGTVGFTVPSVRATYHNMAPELPAPEHLYDKGKSWTAGDEVTLRIRLIRLPCDGVSGLFDRFAEHRKTLSGEVELANTIPFSEAWAIQERKYNRVQWEEKREYYSVGTRENRYQDWQPGWVGGAMSTLALLSEGSEESRERALKTLDFLFSTQTDAGLFHGIAHEGAFYGDGFGVPGTDRWHLIRKSADVLYYVIKHFMLLEKSGLGDRIKPEWKAGARKLADAFSAMWAKYGQFGQFVDVETGEIIVGGSASASLAPAGLALAGKYFEAKGYTETAVASALYFDSEFVRAGITTGGPGEILQCPDSESAFGLLESFVVLYETTGEASWLRPARDMASQCASWCVSYDFQWPAGSEFGRLGLRSAGSVIANVQNKHSAPGICTLSGDSLFKLFRATGEPAYLELIREIAHNLPQYLSREDRPIVSWDGQTLPPGVMCERVNMSDWEGKDKIGGVFNGTCWCEVSNMLTYAELPGLYVQLDSGIVSAIDHIEARAVGRDGEGLLVELRNPTPYAARVKTLVESARQAADAPLGPCAMHGAPTIDLQPGETVTVTYR